MLVYIWRAESGSLCVQQAQCFLEWKWSMTAPASLKICNLLSVLAQLHFLIWKVVGLPQPALCQKGCFDHLGGWLAQSSCPQSTNTGMVVEEALYNISRNCSRSKGQWNPNYVKAASFEILLSQNLDQELRFRNTGQLLILHLNHAKFLSVKSVN